ncbi:MAG: glyoxalase/bleomycin resistance/extradiol dioxygenase family protein [Phycisphaerales bacterium]|nr:glyoxalase/bleomycin resistance/extradiol dioxygenase family protein [Phycisphaerales bacterium]
MPKILHVLETCLYARDLAAMDTFYGQVLGLSRMTAEYPRHVFFYVSDTSVLLIFNPDETSKKQDVPAHGSTGPGHVAMAIETDELNAWRDHLNTNGVPIEREITWGDGSRSIYFRDPAGNSTELVTRGMWRNRRPGDEA